MESKVISKARFKSKTFEGYPCTWMVTICANGASLIEQLILCEEASIEGFTCIRNIFGQSLFYRDMAMKLGTLTTINYIVNAALRENNVLSKDIEL